MDTAGEDNTKQSKQKQKLGVNFTLAANCEYLSEFVGKIKSNKETNMVVW